MSSPTFNDILNNDPFAIVGAVSAATASLIFLSVRGTHASDYANPLQALAVSGISGLVGGIVGYFFHPLAPLVGLAYIPAIRYKMNT